MDQTYTKNLLVKFIYKETTFEETLEIKAAINADPVLNAQYQELLNSYRALPKVKFMPTREAIKNILQYSCQTAILPC